MITEWDKRKYSDILSDHLLDLHDKLYDDYFAKYTAKADIKRSEAVLERQREKELLLYKNEKRRAIPSWPKEVPYNKFKPDLVSWDKEHYMTSASSKFGLMLEMLKKEDRFTVFEQLQTRLGKYRNEKNIITRVVEWKVEI